MNSFEICICIWIGVLVGGLTSWFYMRTSFLSKNKKLLAEMAEINFSDEDSVLLDAMMFYRYFMIYADKWNTEEFQKQVDNLIRHNRNRWIERCKNIQSTKLKKLEKETQKLKRELGIWNNYD